MDITLLVGLLTPYLPFLLGLGQKAIEKGSEKLGEKGAEEIWQKLFPKIQAKQAAQEAVDYLVAGGKVLEQPAQNVKVVFVVLALYQ